MARGWKHQGNPWTLLSKQQPLSLHCMAVTPGKPQFTLSRGLMVHVSKVKTKSRGKSWARFLKLPTPSVASYSEETGHYPLGARIKYARGYSPLLQMKKAWGSGTVPGPRLAQLHLLGDVPCGQ